MEKPSCRMVGFDGNVFAIIARVRRALKEAGQKEQAAEFMQRAFQSNSYHDILDLCMEYVEAE